MNTRIFAPLIYKPSTTGGPDEAPARISPKGGDIVIPPGLPTEQPELSPYQRYSLLLDDSRTIQNNHCPVPVGEARNRMTGKHIKLPCNKWECESCGPHKVKRLKVRFALGDLVPEWFLTLTLHTSDQTKIMAAWNLFITGLRADGYTIRYMLVKEFTRKGKRHLHIIGEGWIPFRELSKRWKRATGGSKWTDISKLRDKGRAVNYVMKYMTKAAGSRLFEKGERRYSASREVIWPAWKSPGKWDVFVYSTGKGVVDTRKFDNYSSWLKRSLGDFIGLLGPPPPPEQLSLKQFPLSFGG